MKKILMALILTLCVGNSFAFVGTPTDTETPTPTGTPPTPTPTYGPVHGVNYYTRGSRLYIQYQSNVYGWGWIENSEKYGPCSMVNASHNPFTGSKFFRMYIALTPNADEGSYYFKYGVAENQSPTPTYLWTRECNIAWYGGTPTPTETPVYGTPVPEDTLTPTPTCTEYLETYLQITNRCNSNASFGLVSYCPGGGTASKAIRIATVCPTQCCAKDSYGYYDCTDQTYHCYCEPGIQTSPVPIATVQDNCGT